MNRKWQFVHNLTINTAYGDSVTFGKGHVDQLLIYWHFHCASISWVPRREKFYWAGRITGLVPDDGTARATPTTARYNRGMQNNMCSTMCLWRNEGDISYRHTRIQKRLMSFSFCHNTLDWEDQSWVKTRWCCGSIQAWIRALGFMVLEWHGGDSWHTFGPLVPTHLH